MGLVPLPAPPTPVRHDATKGPALAASCILLHGQPDRDEYHDPRFPSASNSHWFPWMQKNLLIHGIAAHTPEIPDSWNPHYPTWATEFERYELTPETSLVGHSCGGGFLLRWLSEHPDVQVGRVVLVAPWLDPRREETTDFFDFTIDPLVPTRTAGLTVFHSDDDADDIQESVGMILAAVEGVAAREFHGYGHFCRGDLGSDEFPELLELLLG